MNEHSTILIRRSTVCDTPALRRLAALDNRRLSDGVVYLLAEVDRELVAAAAIDVEAEPLGDPFRPTAEIAAFLADQAAALRRRPGSGVAVRKAA
jgi:hypothetical protein